MKVIVRLAIAGLVHHVMARGIEGGDIFRCDEDRCDFLKRFAGEINKTDGPRLYAWALMTNHVPVRRQKTPLTTFCSTYRNKAASTAN